MHTVIAEHKLADANQDFMDLTVNLIFAVILDVKMEESVLLDISVEILAFLLDLVLVKDLLKV
jgi:hypothetical protein